MDELHEVTKKKMGKSDGCVCSFAPSLSLFFLLSLCTRADMYPLALSVCLYTHSLSSLLR